jgi:hypothetical protein
MIREYTHQALESDHACPSGYYRLQREFLVNQGGRDILCIVGVGMLECSCCAGDSIIAGRGGPYALVPGYVTCWKCRENENGLTVTEVEPVEDAETRRYVASEIRAREGVNNIEFW